jgi:hypothetical protein
MADDGLVLSRMTFVLVADLAPVNRVGEQVVEGAARELLSTPRFPVPRYPGAGDDPALMQVVAKSRALLSSR